MKQLNWGDELCGKEITPEEWVGGIIDADGQWSVIEQRGKHQPVFMDWRAELQDFDPGYQRPIYPHRGWAGKTETELWDAVVNQGRKPLYYAEISAMVHVKPDGELFMGNLYGSHRSEIAPALILALQNALVLSKRLKEAQQ